MSKSTKLTAGEISRIIKWVALTDQTLHQTIKVFWKTRAGTCPMETAFRIMNVKQLPEKDCIIDRDENIVIDFYNWAAGIAQCLSTLKEITMDEVVSKSTEELESLAEELLRDLAQNVEDHRLGHSLPLRKRPVTREEVRSAESFFARTHNTLSEAGIANRDREWYVVSLSVSRPEKTKSKEQEVTGGVKNTSTTPYTTPSQTSASPHPPRNKKLDRTHLEWVATQEQRVHRTVDTYWKKRSGKLLDTPCALAASALRNPTVGLSNETSAFIADFHAWTVYLSQLLRLSREDLLGLCMAEIKQRVHLAILHLAEDELRKKWLLPQAQVSGVNQSTLDQATKQLEKAVERLASWQLAKRSVEKYRTIVNAKDFRELWKEPPSQ